MPPFPYFEILKKAYELILKHRWLWVFGVFVGSATGLNFGSLNFLLPFPSPRRFVRLEDYWGRLNIWAVAHQQAFLFLAAGIVLLLILLVIISNLSKTALVWATPRLAEGADSAGRTKPPNWQNSISAAEKYVWRIIVLQILVSAALLALLLIFLIPIFHLFSAGAVGKGVVLGLLGVVLFVPASIVLSFVHLYGPIFIVLYHLPIYEAVQYSFNLFVDKLWESVILAAFLWGLNFLFIFVLIFSILLASLPVAVGVWLLLKAALVLPALVLLGGTAVLAICYTIVLGAAFAAFQNITWVLAVLHLVKAQKIPKATATLAPEPVAEI